MVILLEPGDRETLLAWFSGARKRVGPDYQPLRWLLTDRVRVREGSINYIEYYCAIAEGAGATVRTKTTEMFVSSSDAAWAEALLGEGEEIVGLHPGSRESNKRWPPERWAAVANAVLAKGATRVVLMAGKGETALVRDIARRVHGNARLIEAGELSIGRTAALMRRCTVCITLDSASRHIAAAVGTSTIALLPQVYQRAWDIYDHAKHIALIGTGTRDALVSSIQVEDVLSALTGVTG